MKTIAAISTAAAPGGIGVIRISGDEARAVGDRVFKSVSGAKLCDMAGYTCRFGHVYAPDGERLDECVARLIVFCAFCSGFCCRCGLCGAGRIYAPRVFKR